MAKVKIDKELCKGCWLCLSVCPSGSLKNSDNLSRLGNRTVEFKGDSCVGCMRCAIICPDCCIEIYEEDE